MQEDISSWKGDPLIDESLSSPSSSNSISWWSLSNNNNAQSLENVTLIGYHQENATNSTQEMPIDMKFNDGHLLSIIGYSILFFFSAVGNLTVLSVIMVRKCRGISPISRMDYMLLHLAVADLTVAFLMMPLEIVWSATVSWYGGDFMCRVMAFFRIFGLYLSSFVLVCLAFDRYFAVKYPMQIISSGRRAKAMIILSWIFATMCSLPQIFIFHVAQHPKFDWYFQCVDFDSLSEEIQLIYNVFVMCMMYAFPLIFIIGLHCGIIVELYKRSQMTSKQTSSSNPLRSDTEGLRRSGIGNIGRAKVKTLKMTIFIVLIFFFCWTPYYIMCLWYWIDRSSAQVLDHKIQKALFLFASANSTANPIVYGIFYFKSTFCSKSSSTCTAGLRGRSSSTSRQSVNRENSIYINSSQIRTAASRKFYTNKANNFNNGLSLSAIGNSNRSLYQNANRGRNENQSPRSIDFVINGRPNVKAIPIINSNCNRSVV